MRERGEGRVGRLERGERGRIEREGRWEREGGEERLIFCWFFLCNLPAPLSEYLLFLFSSLGNQHFTLQIFYENFVYFINNI